MKRLLQAGLIALALNPFTPAWSQDAGRERPRKQADEPLFSMPITQKLVENFLTRAVEEMAQRYDLDDEQFEMADEILKKRVVQFIRDNRAPMQRLFAEFSEVQSGVEPPDADAVAEWAQRALPLMDKAREELGAITGQMRDFMTEDQQLQLDGEWAAFNVGFRMLSGKVGGWADGGWDPQVDWIPNFERRAQVEREERRQRHLAMKEAETRFLAEHGVGPAAAAARKDGAPAAAKHAPDRDPWTLEVEAFIKRYDLNLEQRTQAFRTLHKYRTRRDYYLNKTETVRKMDDATQALAKAESDEQKAALMKRLDDIDKPVKNIHQMLKEALNKIPTRRQRAAAGKHELSKKHGARSERNTEEVAGTGPPK